MSLEQQIIKSSDLLSAALSELKSGTWNMPQSCKEYWIKRAELHVTLAFTAHLLSARKAAWENLKALADPACLVPPSSLTANPSAQNRVRYGSQEIDFAVARHLAIVAYMTVTWSVYDRLANVCGRLSSTNEIAANPKQNPKACEDFLGDDKKRFLGFEANIHIKNAYSWTLKVSYKIRNWVAHEGYEQQGTPLFNGNTFSDGFKLNAGAVGILQDTCDFKNGDFSRCCIPSVDQPWPRQELLEILESYHAENDRMFRSFVKWSVRSFIDQIAAFEESRRLAL